MWKHMDIIAILYQWYSHFKAILHDVSIFQAREEWVVGILCVYIHLSGISSASTVLVKVGKTIKSEHIC